MGFSRQEYCSGLPFPSLGDLPNPRIKPGSPALQADALTSEPPGKPDSTKTCCLRKSLISTAGWSNAQLSLKRVKNFKYFLKKHIYSLHLCLYFCVANKFISIIFLDSSYKRYLSFWFPSLCLRVSRYSTGSATRAQWWPKWEGNPKKRGHMHMKLQYSGHLMRRADSFKKTSMLGEIEGRRRRGQQRKRWLDGIADSMKMSLSKL